MFYQENQHILNTARDIKHFRQREMHICMSVMSCLSHKKILSQMRCIIISDAYDLVIKGNNNTNNNLCIENETDATHTA